MAKVIGQKAGEGGEQAPWAPGTEFNSVHTGQRSGAPEWPAGTQQAGSECLPACLSPGLPQGICVCLPSARERVSFSRGLLFWCLRVCPSGVFSLHPVRVSSSSFSR